MGLMLLLDAETDEEDEDSGAALTPQAPFRLLPDADIEACSGAGDDPSAPARAGLLWPEDEGFDTSPKLPALPFLASTTACPCPEPCACAIAIDSANILPEPVPVNPPAPEVVLKLLL